MDIFGDEKLNHISHPNKVLELTIFMKVNNYI